MNTEHKTDCPLSPKYQGGWAASVPPSCICHLPKTEAWKETFDERFPNGIGTLHELEGEIPPKFQDLTNTMVSFIRETVLRERETLIATIEGMKREVDPLDEAGAHYDTGHNDGIDAALSALRTKV